MSVVARHPKPKANRSRTGCEQCKARKVKCDEQKPSCKRCVAGSKECVYIAPKVWLFEPGRDTGLITGEELYRIPFKPNEASECQNSVCRSRARTNKGDEQHTCQGPLCHARLVGHVQVDAMGQRALNFFINSYAPSYGAIVTLKDGTNGLLTRLLPWALSEDTILETLIAIALATAAEGKLNTDDGRGALMYRQSIISKIMQRLPHGCDHVTLQAVICLIFTDMRLGLIDHCRAHLQGLRAMVVICGGLQSLGCDGMQRDIILLLDEVFHIFDHDEYPDFPGPYPQQPLLTRFSSFAPEIGAQIFGLKSVPLRFRQQDLFPWLREPIVL